jgi:hypothetical protein
MGFITMRSATTHDPRTASTTRGYARGLINTCNSGTHMAKSTPPQRGISRMASVSGSSAQMLAA